MKLAIVGGKLQGTEAVYLAAKAGYETVLFDRRPAPPAAGLADVQHVLDVTADEERTKALLLACDAVLPACEDDDTLAWLAAKLPAWGIPFLFDLDAYRVTSSKLASNRLFAELDVSRPLGWPACGFPAVVKPSTASGSARERRARGGHRRIRGRPVALARGRRPRRPHRGAAGDRPRVRPCLRLQARDRAGRWFAGHAGGL
jgi:3-methylornithine--L-lysine ligase